MGWVANVERRHSVLLLHVILTSVAMNRMFHRSNQTMKQNLNPTRVHM